MNYKATIDYINSFTKSGGPITDLSRFKGLMNRLGNPQNSLKFIHIAGTNGKGSLSEYTAAALQSAGYKVGKFTSPFIVKLEERIQINGAYISESSLADFCTRVKGAAAEDVPYSQFEILTAAAFLYFAWEECDYVVLEVGIGGTLDCTNIITPVLSIITAIDYDHCAILGNTLAEIASHKAGIIKENVPCVVSPYQSEEVLGVLRARAAEMHAPLIEPDMSSFYAVSSGFLGSVFGFEGAHWQTKMGGIHQCANAVTAILALRALGDKRVGEKQIRYALETAQLPARLETVSRNPWIIIDGAHNPSGMMAAKRLLSEEKQCGCIVIGMLKTKDYHKALHTIMPLFDSQGAVPVDFFSPDAVPCEELKNELKGYNVNVAAGKDAEDALSKAVKFAKGKPVFCTGSLYLASRLRAEVLKAKP